jgi:hypothetical protein
VLALVAIAHNEVRDSQATEPLTNPLRTALLKPGCLLVGARDDNDLVCGKLTKRIFHGKERIGISPEVRSIIG